jgi:hypothetical protein
MKPSSPEQAQPPKRGWKKPAAVGALLISTALGVSHFLGDKSGTVDARPTPAATAEASPSSVAPTPLETLPPELLEGSREALQPTAAKTASEIVGDLVLLGTKNPDAAKVYHVTQNDDPQLTMGNGESAAEGTPSMFATYIPNQNHLQIRSELRNAGSGEGQQSNGTIVDLEFEVGGTNPLAVAATDNELTPSDFQTALTAPDINLVASTVTGADGTFQRLQFDGIRVSVTDPTDWNNVYASENPGQDVANMANAITATQTTLHTAVTQTA